MFAPELTPARVCSYFTTKWKSAQIVMRRKSKDITGYSLLEDEALAGVGEFPRDESLVDAERGEGGVIGQARGGDVDGGLAPTLRQNMINYGDEQCFLNPNITVERTGEVVKGAWLHLSNILVRMMTF